MTYEQLRQCKAPFKVFCKIKGGSDGVVIGFALNDPLGVGGGMFPDIPVAYWKGGGWILVSDLIKNYELKKPKKTKPARSPRAAGLKGRKVK